MNILKDKVKRVVLLPDIHHPHHNKAAIGAVFQFIKYFKPHAVNILGDAMNMDAVNHWKQERGNKKYFEGKRLLKEYENFDNEILTPLEQILPENCEKTFMFGNHEEWVNYLIDKNPQLEGLVEIELCLGLRERGWEVIPWIAYDEKVGSYQRGIKRYGKLLTFHGQYTTKYHSAKTAESYGKSCAYAHTHDLQLYTKVTVDDHRDYHTAQSIGCLCNRSPEYMKGRMNKWVNAFGVLYIHDDDNYNLYVPVIINGKFCFEGKIFRG